MANIKLDFSKMKHIHSDDNFTTLQHAKDGHVIKLAHKSLTPDNQKALSALAKMSQQAQTPDQAAQSKMQMAEGGEADPQPQATPTPTTVPTPEPKPDNGQHMTLNSATGKWMTDDERTQAELNQYSAPAQGQPQEPSAWQQIESGANSLGNSIRSAVGADYGTSPNYAAGGDVVPFKPKPGDKEPKVGDNTLNYEKMKPQKKEGGTLNYDKLKREYQEKNKPRFAEGGQTCGHCGQPHKMYAEGTPDQPASQDDNAPDVATKVTPDYKDPMAASQGAPATQTAPMTQEQKRTQEIYNSLNTPMAVLGVDPAMIEKMTEAQRFGANGEPPGNFNAANWRQAQQQEAMEKQQNAANIAMQQQKVIQDNQARVQAGLDPLPIPNTPDGQQIPGSSEAMNAGQMPDQAPMPDQMKPTSPDAIDQSMSDAYGMMQKGYQGAMKGIGQEAQAKGALGDVQSAILQKNADAKTTAMAHYQQSYGELDKERQAFVQDIQNGHIDPQKYWTGDAQGNGGHSKIAAGIGMILAGFNPTNKPNAAIDFLKYQMDKNIEAQSKNLDMKNNLLRANTAQFGNLRDATNMTQIMQADLLQSQLAGAAAKATSPMAKAAAQETIGKLQMEMAPKFQQFAMQRAMMKMANGNQSPDSIDHMLGYMRVVNPEMAKEMESRYVPGVGMSPTTPVPQDVRQQLIAKQTLHNSASDLLNYAQTHTNIIPGTKEYNIGAQKAEIVRQYIREGMLGTVFRDSEKPLLQKFLDDNPAGPLKDISAIPKLKTILDSNNLSMNAIKHAYKLPETQLPREQAAPQFKTVNGVKYMRGPNGEAVPVK